MIEDGHRFREMFRMDVGDFEFILSRISDLSGTIPIESDQ